MQKRELRKLNNAGFTLLEVLIAMVILAVISVPLLRSFVAAAQTNQKARVEAVCTNAAENVAENCRNVKADEIVAKYIGKEFDNSDYDASTDSYTYEVTDNTSPYFGNVAHLDKDGVYTVTIKNQGSMGSSMPDGYYCEVTLDPNMYSNANGENLAQIEPVTIKDSAIFTMPKDFDSKAYDMFVDRNRILGAAYQKKDKAWFRKNLTRTITFDIDKAGEKGIDADGNEVTPDGEGNYPAGTKMIELAKVTMSVDYSLNTTNANDVLPSGQESLNYTTAFLFDNTTSTRELNAVYLFFYPRYQAGLADKESASHEGRDRVIVNNPDNVKTYFYLTAIKGGEDEQFLENYCREKALGVSIVENPDFSLYNKGAITLRTNLNSGAPASKSDVNASLGQLYCTLKYSNTTGTIAKYDTAAGELLSVANTDGKALNTEDTPNRIYKMNVKIYDDQPPKEIPDLTMPSGVAYVKNSIVEFDGTKLEY